VIYPFENGLNPPDGKGVSAPMMMLGFGGAANDKNCWKMNLLPFSKGYMLMYPFHFLVFPDEGVLQQNSQVGLSLVVINEVHNGSTVVSKGLVPTMCGSACVHTSLSSTETLLTVSNTLRGLFWKQVLANTLNSIGSLLLSSAIDVLPWKADQYLQRIKPFYKSNSSCLIEQRQFSWPTCPLLSSHTSQLQVLDQSLQLEVVTIWQLH